MSGVNFMTAGGSQAAKVDPAVLAASEIEDGKVVLIGEAEYICTNLEAGCCQT